MCKILIRWLDIKIKYKNQLHFQKLARKNLIKKKKNTLSAAEKQNNYNLPKNKEEI